MKLFVLPVLVMAVVFASGCTQYGQQTSTSTPAQPTSAAKTIEITSSGFNPITLTINSGETVTFMNKDASPHWPASAVHPTHTVYPGSGIEKCGTGANIFDACRGLAQGETFSFTFDQKGTWKYHDHLNPATDGTITVK